MNVCVIFWIALAIVLVIIEGMTTALVSIWPAVGCVGAAVVAACGAGIPVQLAVFVVLSILLLIATRPLAKKLLKKDRQATNSDMVIGGKAIVTEDITAPEFLGRVKIGGKSWAACTDGVEVSVGAHVLVERIEGVKLIVSADTAKEV